MSRITKSTLRVRIDQTNPGQFFACCGLLELADRFWSGAEGWFDEREPYFQLRPTRLIADDTASTLLNVITRCRLTNTMTEAQLQRRDELSSMKKKQREAAPTLEEEKKKLDALWREAPLRIHEPFQLCIDWFLDERAGGDTFKTWAGQQSVLDIATGMKLSVDTGNWSAIPSEHWFSKCIDADCLPFNFDSDLGGMGSDRDVGFSFDPLKSIRVQIRPLIELLALIGLQRFRPIRIGMDNRYRFSFWFDPLLPEIAATAACDLLESSHSRAFAFRLLYRTKYLKSFLPANRIRRRSEVSHE